MAQTNVSSCVLSIVASFTSGLDVFKKFRESQKRKKRRSKKHVAADDDETRLARSLRLGPEEIGREYQKSVYAAGEQFAQGDGIAQTSLAEILLKLNTGLVTIINTFLTRDKHEAHLDYQSLTSLSERSRDDTCRTLRHLFRRMTQNYVPPSLALDERSRQKQDRSKDGSAVSSNRWKSGSGNRHTRVRGPMLARVVIADSNRPGQVAMVRPGDKKKKSSSTLSSSKVQSTASLALPASSSREKLPGIRGGADTPRMHRKQSALEVGQRPYHGPDALRNSRSTPVLDRPAIQHDPLPAYPPDTSPLPVLPRRMRKPTPTYYSIDTTSTKLGEIPMHKWAEPYDFDAMSRLNKEAEQNGWPLNNPRYTQEPKKRGGLFRLFRRRKEEA